MEHSSVRRPARSAASASAQKTHGKCAPSHPQETVSFDQKASREYSKRSSLPVARGLSPKNEGPPVVTSRAAPFPKLMIIGFSAFGNSVSVQVFVRRRQSVLFLRLARRKRSASACRYQVERSSHLKLSASLLCCSIPPRS